MGPPHGRTLVQQRKRIIHAIPGGCQPCEVAVRLLRVHGQLSRIDRVDLRQHAAQRRQSLSIVS